MVNMKIEIAKEKLLTAITLAEKISSKDITHPILNNLLLNAKNNSLIIRATNLDLGIELLLPIRIEEEGMVVVSGKTLSSVISNIYQSTSVVLETKSGNLSIHDASSRTLLKVYPNEDFPTIPHIGGENTITLQSDDFQRGIRSVWYSASTTTIKPELSSVYMYHDGTHLVFVSTDSFRLAEKKIVIRDGEKIKSILIPFRNIPEIMRVLENIDSSINIVIGENQLSFSLERIYLTSRLIDGTFPDYKQIIPKKYSTEVILLKQDFLHVLKKTGVFLDRFNQVTVVMQPKKKVFTLHTENAEVGETTESVQAALSGEDLTISFNQRYIVDCLQSIHTDSISLSFSGLGKPVVIQGVSDNSFLYLVMPMNK